MLEIEGKVELKLLDNGIKIGGKEVRIPNNIHNFYTAGAYIFYDLPYRGEKPPRAIFYDKGARLVLYQSKRGEAILLYEKGEERVGKLLRREELGLFLEWIRTKTRAVPVGELVFYKKGEFLCMNGLDLSEASRRVIFYALEGILKRKEKKEKDSGEKRDKEGEGETNSQEKPDNSQQKKSKVKVISFKEGRVVVDGKKMVFLKKEGSGYVPEGSVEFNHDNVLRLMSVL